MLVGVNTISLLYDPDSPGDMVFSIDGNVVARDKPHIILDCVNAPIGTPRLVIMVGLPHHYLGNEMEVTVLFQNPIWCSRR